MQEPDRCVVHSNNFNRYLSPFRAEWDPKDPAERLIICGRCCHGWGTFGFAWVCMCVPVCTRGGVGESARGHRTGCKRGKSPPFPLPRYISEDFGGVALHPVDLLDAATGELVGELVDPNLTTISPVNKPHPRTEAIVSGSSRSLFVWRPIPEEGAWGRLCLGERQGEGGCWFMCRKGRAIRPRHRGEGDPARCAGR